MSTPGRSFGSPPPPEEDEDVIARAKVVQF